VCAGREKQAVIRVEPAKKGPGNENGKRNSSKGLTSEGIGPTRGVVNGKTDIRSLKLQRGRGGTEARRYPMEKENV